MVSLHFILSRVSSSVIGCILQVHVYVIVFQSLLCYMLADSMVPSHERRLMIWLQTLMVVTWCEKVRDPLGNAH